MGLWSHCMACAQYDWAPMNNPTPCDPFTIYAKNKIWSTSRFLKINYLHPVDNIYAFLFLVIAAIAALAVINLNDLFLAASACACAAALSIDVVLFAEELDEVCDIAVFVLCKCAAWLTSLATRAGGLRGEFTTDAAAFDAIAARLRDDVDAGEGETAPVARNLALAVWSCCIFALAKRCSALDEGPLERFSFMLVEVTLPRRVTRVCAKALSRRAIDSLRSILFSSVESSLGCLTEGDCNISSSAIVTSRFPLREVTAALNAGLRY
ncbi:hypothetical protein BC938DRAFT_473851 [Jimgerdemannia flammicorona]|uniref:Uncharacterized protein n=1 Tax=Jimgerdemannia flammicorona TaxID=994334 RepID=A0A433Q3C7_9FUNG|nr:hypothetical protein BC938DRAFT_473851 [Jimgerdemannia flammicorona]